MIQAAGMARHETCDIVYTKRRDAVTAGIGKWWLS